MERACFAGTYTPPFRNGRVNADLRLPTPCRAAIPQTKILQNEIFLAPS